MFLTREIVRVFPNHANFREMGTQYFNIESTKIKKTFFSMVFYKTLLYLQTTTWRFVKISN